MEPVRKADDVSAEWRAMRARTYAEEGIAMIVGVETVGTRPPRKGDAELAAAFLALARDPAMPDAEPATILELLAARELRRLA